LSSVHHRRCLRPLSPDESSFASQSSPSSSLLSGPSSWDPQSFFNVRLSTSSSIHSIILFHITGPLSSADLCSFLLSVNAAYIDGAADVSPPVDSIPEARIASRRCSASLPLPLSLVMYVPSRFCLATLSACFFCSFAVSLLLSTAPHLPHGPRSSI
jgi:hypothetical protein